MAIPGYNDTRDTAAAARPVPRGPANIEAAIRSASRETGVDFAYLMEKAAVESSFRPDLKASTSSATGLYQFIDSTWLSTMKEHGAEHGLGRYADAIQRRSDGSLGVADPDMRREILELRKDPRTSALLAAEHTRDNKEFLESRLGRSVGATELYLAHFLGAGGASKFLSAMDQNPNRPAAELLPDAAASNTAVFYDKETGRAKSLAQVYDRFAHKFGDESAGHLVSGRGAVEEATESATGLPAGHRLGGSTLTGYTMLALAALQTPDEAGEGSRTQFGSRRVSAGGREPPANSFRQGWSVRPTL